MGACASGDGMGEVGGIGQGLSIRKGHTGEQATQHDLVLAEDKGKERAGELSGKETMLVQGGIWVTGECTQWLEAPMGQTLGLS